MVAPDERKEAEAHAEPWHEKAWVTVAVWCVALACFAGAAGTMVYAAVVVR